MPADERHLVVDHDDLLVVRVLEAHARVRLCLDVGPAREDLHVRLDVPLRRPEHAERRALPHEEADVDPPGDVREQVAEDDRLLLPGEIELGREAPAEEVDVRLRAGDRLGYSREVRRAVDEHLDAVPGTRLEGRAGREAEPVRVERVLPADLAEPAPVVRRHRMLDALPDGVRDRAGARTFSLAARSRPFRPPRRSCASPTA